MYTYVLHRRVPHLDRDGQPRDDVEIGAQIWPSRSRAAGCPLRGGFCCRICKRATLRFLIRQRRGRRCLTRLQAARQALQDGGLRVPQGLDPRDDVQVDESVPPRLLKRVPLMPREPALLPRIPLLLPISPCATSTPICTRDAPAPRNCIFNG